MEAMTTANVMGADAFVAFFLPAYLQGSIHVPDNGSLAS